MASSSHPISSRLPYSCRANHVSMTKRNKRRLLLGYPRHVCVCLYIFCIQTHGRRPAVLLLCYCFRSFHDVFSWRRTWRASNIINTRWTQKYNEIMMLFLIVATTLELVQGESDHSCSGELLLAHKHEISKTRKLVTKLLLGLTHGFYRFVLKCGNYF